MTPFFDLYLATTPDDTRAALDCGCPLAHIAYSVGPAFRLIKRSIGSSMRGGLLVLSDEQYDGGDGDMPQLTQDVTRECLARGYLGVMLDFEGPVDRALEAFVTEAAPIWASRGLRVYTYPPYADCFAETRVILSTAMVSGRLDERLAKAAVRYPGHRLCVEMERLARDITLPDPTGTGTALDRSALREITEGRVVFFSKEMAAHYLTYKDTQGQTHFVLFDDAHSFEQKIRIAVEQGVHEGFMIYPDVKDMWPELKALLGR